jgi:DNA polymerase III delta prime subunit
MLSLEKAKQLFLNDIDEKRISHAYMISSSADNNLVLEMVEDIARKLLDTSNLNISSDYKYISKKEGKKDLSVEQIREELIAGIYLAPAKGDYKVYVVNDAGNMNLSSQNALLKSLEEPPSYVVIILIKKPSEELLPTIISRVKEIVIDISEEIEACKYIKEKYDVELDENMIKYSKCSIEKAEKLAISDNYNMFKIAEKISDAAGKNKAVESIFLMDKISIKDGLFLDYLENILYMHGKYSKLKVIEKALQRLKQSGNEDIIKTIIAIELAK